MFSMDVNGRLIMRVRFVSNPYPSLLSMNIRTRYSKVVYVQVEKELQKTMHTHAVNFGNRN